MNNTLIRLSTVCLCVITSLLLPSCETMKKLSANHGQNGTRIEVELLPKDPLDIEVEEWGNP